MSDTALLPDLDLTITVGDVHVTCCLVEQPVALCGARPHPEASAQCTPPKAASEDEEPIEANCMACAAIVDDFTCGKGHRHCPFLSGVWLGPQCRGKSRDGV